MLININKFQNKLKWFKIPNFMFYIILFSMIIYFAQIALQINSKSVLIFSVLEFNRAAILKGEVWRILTYVFLVPKIHFVMVFIYVYILNFISNSLEAHWGSIQFTIYYILGYILTTLVGFIGGSTNMVFLNLSLIFVFFSIYPDISVTLFSFLNIKTGWLFSFNVVLFLIKFVISIVVFNLSNLLAESVAILLYLVFFGPYYFINWFKTLKLAMSRQRF